MALVYRDDPYPSYNFELVITGISNDGTAVRGSFAEVSGLDVEIPSFRPDATREVDVIEEVGRQFGFAQIARTQRRAPNVGRLNAMQHQRIIVRLVLRTQLVPSVLRT